MNETAGTKYELPWGQVMESLEVIHNALEQQNYGFAKFNVEALMQSVQAMEEQEADHAK